MTPRVWDIAAIAARLADTMKKWRGRRRVNDQRCRASFIDRCHALGATPPNPPQEVHRFEFPVRVVDRDGDFAANFIGLHRANHFALEGNATGLTNVDENRMREACGQIRTYVAHVSGAPPP